MTTIMSHLHALSAVSSPFSHSTLPAFVWSPSLPLLLPPCTSAYLCQHAILFVFCARRPVPLLQLSPEAPPGRGTIISLSSFCLRWLVDFTAARSTPPTLLALFVVQSQHNISRCIFLNEEILRFL